MPEIDVLQGLNSKQAEAVTHTEGPLLILAGAGSGKTTVLTRRVAYLISRGVHPGSILAITFTNKAANELKTRIEALLGEKAKGVWAMTFHSACVRILRTELPGLGRSGRFTIMDSDDQVKLMRKVLKELNLSEKQYTPSGVLKAISAAKDNLMGPEEYAKTALTFYETKVQQAYELYQRKLRELDGMDFDDLLMETVMMFRTHPQVLAKYQAKFAHILVDEYQDTNRVQYELTKLLAAAHHNIAVVGDDDQSIYTFRGADIRNILEFEEDYPRCRVVKLEQNYRSTQVILDGAFNVVRNNARRKEKRLWTAQEGGQPITLYAAQSGEDEARFVAGEIENLAVQGVPLNAVAILYRTNAQSRTFEEAFVERGIPYSVLSGRRFYDRKHIRDAVAYLRLILNARDAVAFERIVNEPPRGLGPAAVRKITEYAAVSGVDLVQALSAASEIKGLNGPQRKAAAELGTAIGGIALKALGQPPHITLRDVLEATGYIPHLDAQGTAESQERLDDLRELLASVRVFAEAGGGLEEYVEQYALVSDQDTYDETKDACVMGTFHSAKGLEFDVVFLVGMEEGVLPHARSIGEEHQIEEERRLLYVGMTRAKRILYMTFSWSREMSLGLGRARVSRFVSEIPRELLDVKTWED
ncbi:MAG: ATP-dependent helicase [Bacillota bacterium]|jgi:DNA helicase-2/ATP-dependent DNA helicase PcrA|nr:UvrD-helicase domain-containing protein [Candidatus Fermentithermobacillaceae bacterium]